MADKLPRVFVCYCRGKLPAQLASSTLERDRITHLPTMVCHLNASRAGIVALLSTTIIIISSLSSSCSAFTTLSNRASIIHDSHNDVPITLTSYSPSTSTSLYGKKRKGNTPRPNPNYSNKKANQQQEKASVKEARFDAA